MAEKWVYLFDDVDQAEKKAGSWEGVRALLGGKGANLADMTRIGVPVPPGFTVTTEACNAFLAHDKTLPDGLWDQVLEAIKAVEKKSGKDLYKMSCRHCHEAWLSRHGYDARSSETVRRLLRVAADIHGPRDALC